MDFLPPLPVAIPFTVAAALMAASSWVPRRLRDVVAIISAAAVAVVCALLLARSQDGTIVYWFGGWEPRHGVALGIGFVIDPLGAGLALLASCLVLAGLIFSWRYFDEVGALYPALMLIFLGAMAGFCLTGDLFNLFVFFELMSVTAYALTAYKIEEEQALMGAFNFAITNSVGAFLVLSGIGLLYGRTGALNLAQMGQALGSGPPDGLVVIALTLLTCGFAVKAALVPFQFWLADAHAVAPTPVCILFSGVMVELGIYAMARIYWTIFASAVAQGVTPIRDVWLGVGIVTALVGGILCFTACHLKRLLAFSTISHTGLFLVGVALLSSHGLAGTGLYILGHGLVKAALFLGAGILLNRFGSVDEHTLRGAGRPFPGLGLLFMFGGLALSGLPPFGTWLGKALLEEAMGQLGYSWLKPALLIASALTGGAVLRASGRIFLGLGASHEVTDGTPKREQTETKESYDRPPAVMFVPAVVLLGLALAVGLWPGLESQVERAANRFRNQEDYRPAVLRGSERTGAPAETVASASLFWRIFPGVAAALLALVFAALALFSKQIPQAIRMAAHHLAQPPLVVLRSLHSGQAADYVTWITVGVAVIGGLWTLLFMG